MTLAGGRDTFELSGVTVRFAGLPRALATRLRADWAAFVRDGADAPVLSLTVRAGAVPAPPAGEFEPKAMRAELHETRARFAMPEGWAEVDADGRGIVELACGLGPREYYTLLNLFRACLAWRMPSRGGVMLHAAALVVDGRGYALVGPAGSGKSTWAGLGQEGGARVVSDDLILVDGAGRRFELLGAPFRSTLRAPWRPGRWPLAAVLFPQHGARAALARVDPLIAAARLTANLTFVADALEADERVGRVLERLVADVPCARLTFSRDAGFLALLRAWRPDDGSTP